MRELPCRYDIYLPRNMMAIIDRIKWDTTAYAGFSTSTPWQRENESYVSINANAQVGIKGSVFEYWASILRLRKTHTDVLVYGDFALIDVENDHIFAYLRTFQDQKVLVVANFRPREVKWRVPDGFDLQEEKVLVANYEVNFRGDTLSLRPFESFAIFV